MPNLFSDSNTVSSPQPPSVLTIEEVAHELKCSKAHVCNLLNGRVRGATPLPCICLGRRKLVRKSSLEHWLRNNEHNAS